MSEIKHKSQILATIDHLRGRKARPDIDRICTFMLKKFKVESKKTKADLKRCIDIQAVFKVEYKGNVSYRNASKKRKELKRTSEKKDKMRTEKRLMTTAMAELIFVDPDYLEQGVPPSKLLKAMASKECSTYNRKTLECIIEKELENGGLVRMQNGNFTLGAGDRDQDNSMEIYSFNADSNTKLASSNNSSSTSSPMRIKGKPGRKKGSIMNKSKDQGFARADVKKLTGVRVGERHKRAKKVFDPSDNNVPTKKKRGRPVGSLNKSTIKKHSPPISGKSQIMFQQKIKSESAESSEDDDNETNDSHSIKLESRDKVTGGVCSVCRQHQNVKDNSGILVSCRDCSNKAHPSCLRGDGMLRLRPDNTWQCPHCKTCVVCIETNDAGILTVCSVCADAYHALCHIPSIPERLKAWDQWECTNCQETKNTGQHLDPSYIDKMPGSNHSSKYSDGSDSRKSSTDRRRDKSSIKSVDSDDRNDCKLIIAEKDEQSYSPASLDNSGSPVRNAVFEWKQNERSQTEVKIPTIAAECRKPKPPVTGGKSVKSIKSIYMNEHELTKFRSSLTFQKHPNDHGDESFDPTIPNAENWNTNDVYKYFSSYFPEDAHVFKEKEIDGHALLMMRRNDVIHNFGLPLGPALKMYRHVVKLQTRKDDFTMCWM